MDKITRTLINNVPTYNGFNAWPNIFRIDLKLIKDISKTDFPKNLEVIATKILKVFNESGYTKFNILGIGNDVFDSFASSLASADIFDILKSTKPNIRPSDIFISFENKAHEHPELPRFSYMTSPKEMRNIFGNTKEINEYINKIKKSNPSIKNDDSKFMHHIYTDHLLELYNSLNVIYSRISEASLKMDTHYLTRSFDLDYKTASTTINQFREVLTSERETTVLYDKALLEKVANNPEYEKELHKFINQRNQKRIGSEKQNTSNNIEPLMQTSQAVETKPEAAVTPAVASAEKQPAPVNQKELQAKSIEEYLKENPNTINLKTIIDSGQAETMSKILAETAKAIYKQTDIIESRVEAAQLKTNELTKDFINAAAKKPSLMSKNLTPSALMASALLQIDPRAKSANAIRLAITSDYLSHVLDALAAGGVIKNEGIYHNSQKPNVLDFGEDKLNEVIDGVTYTKRTELRPKSMMPDRILDHINEIPKIYNSAFQNANIIDNLAVSYAKFLTYANQEISNEFSKVYNEIRKNSGLPKSFDLATNNFKAQAERPFKTTQEIIDEQAKEKAPEQQIAHKPDSNIITLNNVKPATVANEVTIAKPTTSEDDFAANPKQYLTENNPVALNNNIFFQVSTPKGAELKDSIITIRYSKFDYAETEFKSQKILNKKPDIKSFFNRSTMEKAGNTLNELAGFDADFYQKLLQHNRIAGNVEQVQENGQATIKINNLDDEGIVKYFQQLESKNFDRAAKVFLSTNAGSISYAFDGKQENGKVSVEVDQYGHLNFGGLKDKNIGKEYLIPKVEDILNALGQNTKTEHTGADKKGFSMNSVKSEVFTKLHDALTLQQEINREENRAKKQQAQQVAIG